MTARNVDKLSDICIRFDDTNCTHMVLFPQRDQNWTLLGMLSRVDHCVVIVVKHSSLGRISNTTFGTLPAPALTHPRPLQNSSKHIDDNFWPTMIRETFDLSGRTENFATFSRRVSGFWSARLQRMSAHMGRDHPDAYNLMSEVLPNVTRARMPSPCELCGQEFKSRTHTCPVKKQLGLALADRRHSGQSSSCSTTTSKDGCPIFLCLMPSEVCDHGRTSSTSVP